MFSASTRHWYTMAKFTLVIFAATFLLSENCQRASGAPFFGGDDEPLPKFEDIPLWSAGYDPHAETYEQELPLFETETTTEVNRPSTEPEAPVDQLQALKSNIAEYLQNHPEDEDSLRKAFPKPKTKKKYYFGRYFKANHYDASVYCKHRGMKLASVESPQEQEELESVVNSVVSGCDFGALWTSGSDSELEGNYVWNSTGNPVRYINWGRNQPNNSINVNCLAVLKTSEGYKWYVKSCGDQNYFVCEFHEEILEHNTINPSTSN